MSDPCEFHVNTGAFCSICLYQENVELKERIAELERAICASPPCVACVDCIANEKRIAELEDMLRLCKQLMTEPDEELSDDLYWHIAKLIKEKDNE